MSIRGNFQAIERGAGKARPGAAVVPSKTAFKLLGGLLLLIAP
jgi:hypothetical protein